MQALDKPEFWTVLTKQLVEKSQELTAEVIKEGSSELLALQLVIGISGALALLTESVAAALKDIADAQQ